MDNKKQEQEHASTLQRIANQEKAEAAKMKKGGSTNKYMKFSDTGTPMGMAPVKMARGGGIEQRGKTKGKFV